MELSTALYSKTSYGLNTQGSFTLANWNSSLDIIL